MLCAIWYHLYDLKIVKNTHGGELILRKLQSATLLKVTLLHGSHIVSIKQRCVSVSFYLKKRGVMGSVLVEECLRGE